MNEAVLFLNALALRSHNSSLPAYIQVGGSIRSRKFQIYVQINDMKEQGLIKTGSFTMEEDQSILAQYHRLLNETKVDREKLEEEMYSKKKSRSFMLQRQLVGFYLLQELRCGNTRLPVEVFSRLGTLGSYGAFTEEEEVAILAWVEQHGPKDWTVLASKLNRKYLLAGNSVKEHYHILKNRMQKKKTGKYSDEELEAIIQYVFQQNPKVLALTHMFSHGVDFGPIAETLNRSKMGVYEVFSDDIHPLLRRFEAGTLEKDVREDILSYAKSRGWKSGIEIDFEEMASQEQFKGHTRPSLHRLFDGMLNNTNVKLVGKKSKKGITVSQVEEWWNRSERRGKTPKRKNREDVIVQTYLRVKEDIKEI